MTDEVNNPDILVRSYLLGGLTEAQREEIERRVFTDPEYSEKVELIEEELIDEFVDGRLPEKEREAFAVHLLANPHLRLDVGIVGKLKQHGAVASSPVTTSAATGVAVEPEPGPGRFVLWLRRFRMPLAATCAALLLITAGILLWRNLEARRFEQQIIYDRSRSEIIDREVARLNAPGDEVAAGAALEAMASPSTRAELSPGVSRGGAQDRAAYPTLSPRPGAAYARLRLKLEPSMAGFQSYRARFKSVDGGVSFEADLRPSLEEEGLGLWVTLPLGVLPNGDYQVELDGRRDGGPPQELPNHYYTFRITGR